MNTPWDKAKKLKWVGGLDLNQAKVDPGARYFVAMLHQLGFQTWFSCEGHPNGFYIVFTGPYRKALRLANAGYFSVEIEGASRWSLRFNRKVTNRERISCLRWASQSWEDNWGKLKPTKRQRRSHA